MARIFLVGLLAVSMFTSVARVSADELRLIPCFLKSTTGIDCPGCGLTRSCVSLARGDLQAAWRYHPFAWLIVGLAMAVAVCPSWCSHTWQRTPPRVRFGGMALIVVLLFLLWTVRMTSSLGT